MNAPTGAAAERLAEVNRIATLLMEAWYRVDPKSDVTKHPVSYVANFADMARAIISDRNTRPPADAAAVREAAKPLPWSEPHPSHSYPNWHALVPSIRFEARIDTSKPAMYGRFPLSINGSLVVEKFDTVEAAKAYAQADFAGRINALIVRQLDLPGGEEVERLLRDPSFVHLNMLRGGIAKPTIANIIHLYGRDALLEALTPARVELSGG